MGLSQIPAYQSDLPEFLVKIFSSDIKTLNIIFFSSCLLLGFLIILPGVRGNERKYNFVRHSIWVITGLGLIVSYYSQYWVTLNFQPSVDLRTGFNMEMIKSLELRQPAVTTERLNFDPDFEQVNNNGLPVKVNLRVGLQNMNITVDFAGLYLNDKFKFRDKTVDFDYKHDILEAGKSLPTQKLISMIRPNIRSRRHITDIGRYFLRAGRGTENLLLIASYFWIISIILMHLAIDAGILLTLISGIFMLASVIYYFLMTKISKDFSHGIFIDGMHANFEYSLCFVFLLWIAIFNIIYSLILQYLHIRHTDFLEQFLNYSLDEQVDIYPARYSTSINGGNCEKGKKRESRANCEGIFPDSEKGGRPSEFNPPKMANTPKSEKSFLNVVEATQKIENYRISIRNNKAFLNDTEDENNSNNSSRRESDITIQTLDSYKEPIIIEPPSDMTSSESTKPSEVTSENNLNPCLKIVPYGVDFERAASDEVNLKRKITSVSDLGLDPLDRIKSLPRFEPRHIHSDAYKKRSYKMSSSRRRSKTTKIPSMYAKNKPQPIMKHDSTYTVTKKSIKNWPDKSKTDSQNSSCRSYKAVSFASEKSEILENTLDEKIEYCGDM